MTIDQQFGVAWPAVFQQALAALAIISFDIGIFTSMMCIVQVTFYGTLIFTTISLVAAVTAAYLVYLLLLRTHQAKLGSHHVDSAGVWRAQREATASHTEKALQIRRSCLFFVVYLLVFAYPGE
jgi:hypothetical protein